MNGFRFPRAFLTAAVVAVVAACTSITDNTGPLTLQLSTEASTVQAGQNLGVTYDASGSYITGILVEYGDGAVDSVSTFGSQTAHGRLQHAWESEGDYTVVGTVYGGSQGSTSDQVTVHVDPAPAGGA